ncbi:uncharacterized protein LOC116426892 [Nomia melanderi]|uniref:uncharacterized protein LOC116426892 n=1 Tax=Nomia melanderi TaxID=2448451 RepID=UPI003FCCACA0
MKGETTGRESPRLRSAITLAHDTKDEPYSKYLSFRRKSDNESKTLPRETFKPNVSKRDAEIEDIWASVPRDYEMRTTRRREIHGSRKLIPETYKHDTRMHVEDTPSVRRVSVTRELRENTSVKDSPETLHDLKPYTRRPVTDVEVTLPSRVNDSKKSLIKNGEVHG